tara:strand:+ start:54 stop:449 length:396 start_codon:yes stop_codon:yes gene_type:complete
MKNNKVVYIHRKKSDDTIFYVGMGNSYRPNKKKGSRSVFWNRTVTKHGYYIEVLFDGLSTEEAFYIEKYLISKFGRRDLGLGDLVNMTNGGEGRTSREYQHEDLPYHSKSELLFILKNCHPRNIDYDSKQN